MFFAPIETQKWFSVVQNYPTSALKSVNKKLWLRMVRIETDCIAQFFSTFSLMPSKNNYKLVSIRFIMNDYMTFYSPFEKFS